MRILRLLPVSAVCLLVTTTLARAATFNVNSPTDAVDASPGNGVCATAGGQCTLRAAIQEANALAGPDIIMVPAGTYVLTIGGRCEDAAATGDLDVTDDVTIVGAGAPATIIDGNGIDRVFDVAANANIQGMTIRNGDSHTMSCVPSGGAIFSAPATTAIMLALTDVAVTQSKGTAGGGIDNESGSTLVLNRVTVSGNTADLTGGGIQNLASAPGATLTNVTVSGNSAGSGAGIHNEGDLALASVTISGNSLDDVGERTVMDTIIAGSPSNCTGGGATLAEDHNLDSGNTCSFVSSTDLTNTNPSLSPLQDNGGPTLTHALLPGSPAIDTGSGNCPPPATDQRGVSRPQPPGGRCDIGAYEFVPGTIVTTTTLSGASSTTTTLPCTSARCVLDAGLTGPMCAGEAVPASVTKKFDRAVSLINQVATKSGKKAMKLLKRAKKALKQGEANATRAAKRRKAKISADCAAALKSAADHVISGLGV